MAALHTERPTGAHLNPIHKQPLVKLFSVYAVAKQSGATGAKPTALVRVSQLPGGVDRIVNLTWDLLWGMQFIE